MNSPYTSRLRMVIAVGSAVAIAATVASAATPLRDPRPNYPSRRLQDRGGLANPVPHPAVARIIVAEGHTMSFGSGTLVDVRGEYGLVVTNWHVVCDAQDAIDVIFPGGFRSRARALKIDQDWDLAALVIWRPPLEPVRLAARAPQPGEALTICGYGPGNYRAARGRCTQYYAPRPDFPTEMVELSVEARQGDSGGPILNERGELAGVLFGAGEGTTMGSFGGRVEHFLSSLTKSGNPDGEGDAPNVIARHSARNPPTKPDQSIAQLGPPAQISGNEDGLPHLPYPGAPPTARGAVSSHGPGPPRGTREHPPVSWHDLAGSTWMEQAKSALALVGLASLGAMLVRRLA